MLRAIPGVEVLEPVDDGNSALEVLGIRRVDLVILDSSLSEDALLTTVIRIKNQHPSVRCLVLTDEPDQRQTLRAAGTDAVLIKGFSVVTISEKIKCLLACAEDTTE
jgi:DNA-binding NarL/FixJ family response regulator